MPTDAAGPAPESQLIAAYRGLQRRIDAMITDARAGGRSTVYLESQARAAAAALRDVQAAEQGLSAGIQDQYARSAQAAQLTLAESGLATIQGSFTGFDRAAVRFLQDRVSSRLTGVRQALTDGLGLGDPKTAARFIEAALAADGKLVRTVAGELKVLTPSGRYWDPTAYSRMLGRTGIADARRVAFRQRYLQNGVDVVKIVANGTTHEECAVWEDELVSLTGDTPGYPTIADAEAEGLFHPHCRHRYVAALPSEVKEAVQVPEEIAPAAAIPEAPPALPPLDFVQELNLNVPAALRARPILNELPIVPRTPGPSLARSPGVVSTRPVLPPAAGSFDPLKPFDAGTEAALQRISAATHLTDTQGGALDYYRGRGYRDVNGTLRGKTGLSAADQKLASDLIPDLDAAIAGQTIEEQLVIYRGTYSPNSVRYFNNYRVGTEFTDVGYGSWSGSRHQAVGFATAGLKTSDQTLFRLQLRPGDKALYAGPLENEMLLPRGTRYRIVSVEENVAAQAFRDGTVYKLRVVTLEIAPGASGSVARELEQAVVAKRALPVARTVAARTPATKVLSTRGPAAEPIASPEAYTAAAESKYPAAGERVGGLDVGADIDNQDSIGASLYQYEILDDIRIVEMDPEFAAGKATFYSKTEAERIRALAEEIRASGHIDPLIAVDDGSPFPYVLEGGHRIEALRLLGIRQYPAMVVVDESAIAEKLAEGAAAAKELTAAAKRSAVTETLRQQLAPGKVLVPRTPRTRIR